jgi:predicted nucleic acid-binding Zn finger protein
MEELDLLYTLKLNYESETIKSSEDEIISSFAFALYEKQALMGAALSLIDNSEITKLKSRTSDRYVWVVQGSKKTEYVVLERFCPCKSYFEQSKCERNPFCKHIVAVYVAASLKRYKENIVSDEIFSSTLGSYQNDTS